MKKGYIGMVCSFFQGMAIAVLGMALGKLGKYAPATEAGLFITGGVFVGIALFIFYRYKLGDKINPKLRPQVRELLTRYPSLAMYGALVIGIAVVSLCFQIFDV